MESKTKGRTFPPEVLSKAEVRALMQACGRSQTGTRNRALIAVMWRAGLRVSEALALKPSDVDAERGTVSVASGKGGRHRTVGLDPEALAYVELWRNVRANLGVNGRKPLFCTLEGKGMQSSYVRSLFVRLTKRAGLERRANPHALRHTLAAELVEEGQPLQTVQAQLGHASLDGTAHYLRRIAPQDLVEVARSRPSWDTADWEGSFGGVRRV